jgi:putative oxidoreductase
VVRVGTDGGMRLVKPIARVLIGGLFIGHGTQKLRGWFGGPGIDGMSAGMEKMGMHPPRRNAYAAGLSETVGGSLLALGLCTPLAASMLTGTMAVAIEKVHRSNGPWVTDGGWEYNAVLIAAALSFAENGPGDLSLDHALGIEQKGLPIALAAAGVGAAAAYATLRSARARASAQVETSTEDAEPKTPQPVS